MQGVLATLLAGLALTAWIAIGSIPVKRSAADVSPEVALPGSLLVGSGLTAAAFAVLTRLGIVDGAMWLVGGASLLVLVLQRHVTREMIGDIAAEYRRTLGSSGFLRTVAIPVAALLWINAIAPPRDADVMRYHLAHIRQIISDGGWQTIPDYHYAFPFGWTLNYLPFERLHLPQAASLVNVGLWLALLGGLFRIARTSLASRNAILVCVAFLVHPFVLHTFASAMADGYAIFVVYAIALLLAKVDDHQTSVATLLGFACWIGVQSRYQLVGAALAATAVFVWIAARRGSWRDLLHFSAGAAASLLLSAPFYIANLTGLGNPVWPLFIPAINGTGTYADRVAAAYSRSLTGSYDLPFILRSFVELLWTPSLVPLALLLVVIIPASLWMRDLRHRRVAIFGTIFLGLWGLTQPRFFRKQVILVLALGPLLAVPTIGGRLSAPAARRMIHGALAAAIVAMVGLSAVLSWDYARYAATGDKTEFHRFTWYYPVYDWVNHNTPTNARFLVVVYSGHSYYLDRRYRRADPWLSGVVDWSRVSSPENLDEVLRSGGYDYVIFDDRDWSDFYGGSAMSSSVKGAIGKGMLLPVHASRERLYSSRIRRKFTETTVYVLRRVTHG